MPAPIPHQLAALVPLSLNLSWSWRPEARALFQTLDPDLFEATSGNPVAVLKRVDAKTLEAFSADQGYLKQLSSVCAAVEAANTEGRFLDSSSEDTESMLVAYFCAEFGMTEALPIYSGGLGVLAGEHVKSASDLGLPFVGVGLFYRGGYFQQTLSDDGWQQADPHHLNPHLLPVQPALTPAGDQAIVHIDMDGRQVAVQVWEVQVGRVTLYLLDSNVPSNDDYDRGITAQLYSGDTEMRLRQEMVLGMGGYRALKALGISPTVYHLNEGHAAFLALERIADTIAAEDLTFEAAHAKCAANNVFTTHTPVPAGFDIFTLEQVKRMLPKMPGRCRTSLETICRLAAHVDDPNFTKGFNMAYLALRSSAWLNGVSQLHAEVSRGMWKHLWHGELAEDEVPIVGVTNGIHTASWVSTEMAGALSEASGLPWPQHASSPDLWGAVDKITDAQLWDIRGRARQELIEVVRTRRPAELIERNASTETIEAAKQLLVPGALTIGFARRFATYKRAALVFRNRERILKLLTDNERPLQFVFAGKAHPKDKPGQALLREIDAISQDPAFKGRVVFLQGYDIGVARHMVQGVDVWLNTPRRPKEASGTSGMKVPPNGGLNLSIRDGWWAEAYDGDNGWAIGAGEVWDNAETGDDADADYLLDVLEQSVIPEFYDRDAQGLPQAWLKRVRASMKSVSPVYTTQRMVTDYTQMLYLPAHLEGMRLAAEPGAVPSVKPAPM